MNGIAFQEKTTNTIEIKEFDSENVELMIQFLYTGAYTFTPQKCNEPNCNKRCSRIVLKHVEVVAIAEYYDIPSLVITATTAISDILEKLHCFVQLPQAIDEVYHKTYDQGLRTWISWAAAMNIDKLLEMESFTKSENMSPFSVAVISHLISNKRS